MTCECGRPRLNNIGSLCAFCRRGQTYFDEGNEEFRALETQADSLITEHALVNFETQDVSRESTLQHEPNAFVGLSSKFLRGPSKAQSRWCVR